jgi:hypothetical protein
MALIRLEGFQGENRALQPKLLQPTVGVASRNQKPGRGDLRPWRTPSTVATIPAGRNTIYRMGRDVASDAQYWLSWTGDVHAVLGFDSGDSTERTYYTGDGAPKVTNNTMALNSPPYPTTSRPLGLPGPTISLTKNATGGVSEDLMTYYYVYTFVNDWGWESAPSPVGTSITCKVDDTITLSGFDSAPAGNYNVTLIRIYRTQTGTTGATDYYFLREVAYGTASVVDDNRPLGELLETTSWLPPPASLRHLTSLWNGMFAGIHENTVKFCEAYVPYAWPVAYDVVPTDSIPVALGVFGQSLLVLTTGRPVLVSGSSPEAMDQQMLEIPQGCASAKSVVSMGNGVAWSSEDGLCWFGSGGAKLLTAGLMTRDDWQAMEPSSIIGYMYEGLYFGSYDDGSGRKGFMIDPNNPTGLYFLDTGYAVAHFDELQDQLYVVNGASIQRWDAGTDMTYRFRSKVFRQTRPICFACAEVVADAYPVTFRMYADGVLKHTQTVASRNPFRLPAGFMAMDWQIEIEGSNPVQYAAMAGSMTELAEA